MKLPISPRLAFLCRATGHRFFYSRQYRRDLNCGGMQPPAAISFERFGDDFWVTMHYCCGWRGPVAKRHQANVKAQIEAIYR